jgi:membrane protein implicated in regulation of membrane protease activity
VPAGAGVAAVADRTVLLVLIALLIAFIVWACFCACLMWLLRTAVPRCQGIAHTAADRARAFRDLCGEIAEHLHATAGAWSDEPDAYAATAAAAAAHHHSHRKTTTTGGSR